MPLKLIRSPVTGEYYPVNIVGDTPTPEEKERIRQYLLMKEREVPVVQEEIQKNYAPKSGFGALGVGVDQAKHLGLSFMQGVNRMVGDDEDADEYQEMLNKLGRKIRQESAGLQKFKEIDSIGDAARFAGETILQTVPSTAVALTGAVIGTATLPVSGTLLGVGVSGAVGGAVASLPLFMGGNREAQKESLRRQGKPVEVDEGAAFFTALPQALLESWGTIFITSIKKAGLKVNPQAFESGGLFTRLVDKATGTAPRRIGGAIGTGAVAESVTEVGQLLLERQQAGMSIDFNDPEVVDQVIEAAVAGGLVGGVFKGGVTGVSEFSERKKKADKQTELNNDLEDEYRQNVEMQKNAQQSFTNNPALLMAEEGSPITDGLTKSGDVLASETREPRPVKPEELTAKQLAVIRNERTKKGVSLDETQFPITLEEIKATLGPREARRLASKQGIPVKDINTATVSKFSYDQYKKVLENIRKNKDRDFSENKINAIIQKTTGFKSGELTQAIRNELVGRGHLRATQDRAYRMETGMSIPVGEVEFQKAREFTEGRLAKESKQLDDRIIEAQKQLETGQVEGRKERGKKRFTMPTLAQQLQDKVELANKLDTIKDNVTESVVPAINKLIKPYIANKTVKPFKTPLDVFKGINTILGSATSNNTRGVPYGLRKEIRDLQEEVAKTERGIEADKQSHMFLQTSDFSVDNVKFGMRGSSQSNDPEMLFARQRQKEEQLRRKEQEVETEQATARELKKNVRVLADQEAYEKQVDKIKGIQEEIQKLRRDAKELEDIRRKPTASVTQNQGQNQSNQMNATASLGSTKPFVNEYQQNLNEVGNRLRSYLKDDLKLNPDRVELITKNYIQKDGFVFPQMQRAGHNKRAITLAMQLFDRDTIADPTKQDMILDRIKGTLNHEVLHSLRALGLFTEQEFQTLVKAANTRKKVLWREGKVVERQYTYLDRVKRIYRRDRFPDMGEKAFNDMVQEEAVADLFQDAMDGKLKLGGVQKTLLQRIIDLFKAIYKANIDNEFDDISQIIEDVKSGKIGMRKPQELSSDDQVRFSLGEDVYNNAQKEKIKVDELDVYSRVEGVNANKPDTEFLANYKNRVGPLGHDISKVGHNPVGYRPIYEDEYVKTILVPTDQAAKLLAPIDIGSETIDSIAEGIEKYDVKINPPQISVELSEDGKSLLVTSGEGRKRIQALKKLGYKNVAVDLMSRKGKFYKSELEAYAKPKILINRIGYDPTNPDKGSRGVVYSINDNNYATITQERDIDKLGFYSKALEVIEKMPQKKGTGEQFLKYMEGKVKKDELLWTGVQDYLENTDKVTKDELLALMSSNRIYVEETELLAFGRPEQRKDLIQLPNPIPEKLPSEKEAIADALLFSDKRGKNKDATPRYPAETKGQPIVSDKGIFEQFNHPDELKDLISQGAVTTYEGYYNRPTDGLNIELALDFRKDATETAALKYQIIEVKNEQAVRKMIELRRDQIKVLRQNGIIEESKIQEFEDILSIFEDSNGELTEDAFNEYERMQEKAGLSTENTFYVLRFEGETNRRIRDSRRDQKYDKETLEKDAVFKITLPYHPQGQNVPRRKIILSLTKRIQDHAIQKGDFGTPEDVEAYRQLREKENQEIREQNIEIEKQRVEIQKQNEEIAKANILALPADNERATLNGGSNYRVFEIELPAEAFPKLKYNPIHFKGKRQLVFALGRDRIMPDGRKGLYIDQLQSDWGQRGRKSGFADPVLREDVDYSIKQIRDIIKGMKGYFQKRLDQLAEGINITGLTDKTLERKVKKRQQELDSTEKVMEENARQIYKLPFPLREGVKNIELLNGALMQLNELTYSDNFDKGKNLIPELDDSADPVSISFRNLGSTKLNRFNGFGQYPNAPFITQTQHWSKLMVKRLLKRASDEGYDYVIFAGGNSVVEQLGQPEGNRNYYDDQLPGFVRDVLKPLDKEAFLGTYQDQIRKLVGRGMTELTQQERESILNYYDSTIDDKSKMNMDVVYTPEQRQEMVDAIVKLRQTTGVTQALVLNALQRNQYTTISASALAQGIERGNPQIEQMLTRPLSELFATALPTGKVIPVSQEQRNKESKAIKSQLVTFPAYEGETDIRGEVLVSKTKSDKKYYDTFVNHDQKGRPREGTDFGLLYYDNKYDAPSNDNSTRTVRRNSRLDYGALHKSYAIRLTEKLKEQLSLGQELFSLGYTPEGDKVTGIDKNLMERVISTLTDNQYLISSLPELEDDTKGDPTLNFRNLIPSTGRRNVPVVMRDYLTHRQNRAGDFRINLDDVTDADKDNISTIMAAEAEVALARDGNAIGWYDAKFRAAKSLIGLIRPEILNNPEHDAVFDYALAVTSNGIAVNQNFDYALRQYDYWVENGKFEEVGYGQSAKAMEAHFALYNTLTDLMKSGDYKRPKRLDNYPPEAIGVDIEHFLDRDIKIRDLINDPVLSGIAERSGVSLSSLGSQEKKDTVVKMSTIIGSKIGGGFYQNLRGNYDPLTMDKWWMRFFNRITGNPFKIPQDKTQLKNYNDFLQEITVNKANLKPIEKQLLKQARNMIGNVPLRRDMTARTNQRMDQRVIDLAIEYSILRNAYFNRMSDGATEGFPDGVVAKGPNKTTPEENILIRSTNRDRYDLNQKPQSVLLADSIKRNFKDFPADSPRSATDRELMRETTEMAIKKLEQRGVVARGALTNSDFQALMWFHEKELMDKLGAKLGSGEQNDFVDSAIQALRERGIDDDTIKETLPIAERGRIVGAGDAERRVAEPSEGSIAARQQLATFKSVKEKNDITRKQAEDIKKELDQKRQPFYSLGYIPEERERDRANFESTLRANVQDFQHKWNYSASSDFVAKILGGIKIGQSFQLGYSDEKAKALSDLFIRKFQDRMIPVSRMVDELQEKGFKLTDALNPIMQARLSQGKANEEIRDKRETIHKDVVEAVSKLNFTDAEFEQLKSVSNAATDPDQGGEGYIEVVMKDFMPSFWRRMLFGTPSKKLVMAETYLYALHAKERNNYVREIDVNNINQFKDRGSGMSDREADAILNWFRNQERELENLNDIRTKIQRVIDDTNEVRRNSGLQAMFLRGSNWTNYVPLRGAFDPEDETVDFNNAGQRKAPLFGSKGREDPVVKGRIDYAPNLIVNTLTQNANSIMRAAQNNVGRVVLDMIREDPVMLQEFATIQDTVPERMFVDARTGVLSKSPATRDDVAKDKHILIVKENGNEVVIRFNSAVVAGAFRGDTGAGDAASNSYLMMANKFNRYLSSINTTFNPEFIIPNFVRDVQTAAVNIDQYEGERLKTIVVKRSPAMARGIYKAVQKNDMSSPEAQMYDAFVKAGGKNVTNQMTTLGDQVADIQNTLNAISEGGARGGLAKMKENFVGKKVSSLINWIENTNTAMENAVRVSTFEALLNTGRYTEQQAALAAREITVNFARGGEYKTFLNSLYLFFNASLQGTFALAEAATRSKNVRRLWVGIVVAGILSDQINAFFSDEDEDGKLIYDKTTDYTLEHNFLIPNLAGKAMDAVRDEEDNVIQKNSFSVPLPYGINLAFNVGRSLSRRMRGAYTPAQATSSIMSTTFEALNPLGGSESIGNMALPTVVDPFYSLLANINYDRTPITKQVSQFAVGTPDSQTYWNSASPMSVSVAQFLNRALGGNEVKSGMIDVSPDTLDFLFNYFTGGAGMFVQRTATFGYDLSTGNVFEAFEDGLTGEAVREQIRKTPILRKAITSVSEREDTGNFIQKRNVIFGAKKELKEAIASRDMDEIRRVRNKFPKELRIYGIIRAINTKRQKLTSLRNKLIRAEKTAKNKEVYEARIKRLDKQIQALIGRGNSLMKNIELDFFTEYGLTGY